MCAGTTPLWRRDGEGQVACNACGESRRSSSSPRPAHGPPPVLEHPLRRARRRADSEGARRVDHAALERAGPTTAEARGLTLLGRSQALPALFLVVARSPLVGRARKARYLISSNALGCWIARAAKPTGRRRGGFSHPRTRIGSRDGTSNSRGRLHWVTECDRAVADRPALPPSRPPPSSSSLPSPLADSPRSHRLACCTRRRRHPGLYYKLHGQHRPVNLKKPTIKRRRRVPAAPTPQVRPSPLTIWTRSSCS